MTHCITLTWSINFSRSQTVASALNTVALALALDSAVKSLALTNDNQVLDNNTEDKKRTSQKYNYYWVSFQRCSA